MKMYLTTGHTGYLRSHFGVMHDASKPYAVVEMTYDGKTVARVVGRFASYRGACVSLASRKRRHLPKTQE
jgi:hypothetical protein